MMEVGYEAFGTSTEKGCRPQTRASCEVLCFASV